MYQNFCEQKTIRAPSPVYLLTKVKRYSVDHDSKGGRNSSLDG